MKKLFLLFVIVSISVAISSCEKPVAPTVSTTDATNIQYQTATLNGNITSDGGAAITGRGFIYSTAQGVTIGGDGVNQIDAGSGDGAFSADISSLSPNTTYYYKAFGVNEVGTTEGTEKSFSTL